MPRTLLAALVLVAPAGAAAQEKAKGKVPNLYPTAKGTKWEYDVTVGGDKSRLTAEVVESQTKDGKTEAKLQYVIRGHTIEEEVSTDATGVYRRAFQGARFDNPVRLVKYPAEAGSTWEEKVKARGMEEDTSFKIQHAEEVTVPAGKYKAVPVAMTAKIGGQTITTTNWYAEGVGVVRQTVTIGGMTNTQELTKFTPGK